MPASKTERLVNLVICLLASRTFVTKERLRSTLEPYRNCPTDEAFERMFERDKEELRELGIPLEVGTVSALFEDEVGYRIAPGEYALPELRLEPDEAAALGVAARFWQQATLAQAASSALLKLKAAGLDIGEAAPPGSSRGCGPRPRPSSRCWRRCTTARWSASPTAARTARCACARSSRGRSTPGAAAGTWPGSTWAGTTRGSSASTGSPARCC